MRTLEIEPPPRFHSVETAPAAQQHDPIGPERRNLASSRADVCLLMVLARQSRGQRSVRSVDNRTEVWHVFAMLGPPKPFVVKANDGEAFRSPIGGPMTIKARAETTSGSFAALVNLVPPKEGPPLHRHGREDEMYYILDGHLRFKLDGVLHDAPTGAFVFIPRGTPHCFQNVGDAPARILVMFTPAGMERFFEGQVELPAGPMDTGAHRALAQSAAMEILGPPLAVSDPLVPQGGSDGAH